MLHDALPLVTKLHIEKASQLRTGIVLRHLRDVRSVTIYNLFYRFSDRFQMDDEIATQSVHFLSLLPHLESVTFWGRDGNRLRSLNSMRLHINNPTTTSQLLESFSSAFDYGGLPTHLQINGLRCQHASTGDCKVCKRVCKMFPLERIGDIDLCLPIATSKELIKTRLGGRDYLHSETRFMQLLGLCQLTGRRYIIGFNVEVQGELKSFIESSSIDVAKLNPEDVAKAIKRRHTPNNNSICYLSGDSFDLLKSIGIPISNILLDPWDIRIENLDRMVRSVMGEKASFFRPEDGLGRIDSLLRQQDPPIQRVLKSGVLPKLVEILRMNDELKLHQIASSVLTKLASYLGGNEHVDEIVISGVIPPLVGLLNSLHTELHLNAAQALGNISGKGTQYRDLVLQAGVLEPLVKRLGDNPTGNLKSVRTYVWLLSNLCRGKPKPDFNFFESPPLETFNALIRHPNDEVMGYACCFLGYLYGKGSNNTHIQAMIDGHCDKWASIYHEYERKDNVNVYLNMLENYCQEIIMWIDDDVSY